MHKHNFSFCVHVYTKNCIILFCNEPAARKSSVQGIIIIFNGCIIQTRGIKFKKFGKNMDYFPPSQKKLVKQIIHNQNDKFQVHNPLYEVLGAKCVLEFRAF